MSTEASVTIGKAFRVLQLFRHHPVMTVTACESALGIPRSTAHRLLVSLRDAGAVEQTRGGHYRLSLELFELGVMAPQRRSLEDRIGGGVEALADSTGLRVHVAVRRGLEVVYIESANGPLAQSRGIRTRVGHRGPLHATSAGKLLLAYGSEALLQRLLATELEAYTPQTVIDEAGLRQELEQIRHESVAFAVGQFAQDSAALAVPIRGWDGSVQAALSIVGDSTTIVRHRTRFVEDARRTAARIEKGIGGTFRRAVGEHSLVVTTGPGSL